MHYQAHRSQPGCDICTVEKITEGIAAAVGTAGSVEVSVVRDSPRGPYAWMVREAGTARIVDRGWVLNVRDALSALDGRGLRVTVWTRHPIAL